MSSATVAGGAGSDGDATPAGAPLGLMSQFLAAVAKEDFDVAIRIANEILVTEPENAMVREYVAVLAQMKILRAEQSKPESDDEADEAGAGAGAGGEGAEEDEDEDEDDDDDDEEDEESDEEEEAEGGVAAEDATLDSTAQPKQ